MSVLVKTAAELNLEIIMSWAAKPTQRQLITEKKSPSYFSDMGFTPMRCIIQENSCYLCSYKQNEADFKEF